MLNNPNWTPPEVKVEVWQQLLLDAATILRTNNWCQRELCRPISYFSGDGGYAYCMLGALQMAAEGVCLGNAPRVEEFSTRQMGMDYWKAHEAIRKQIGLSIFTSLWEWNDSPNRMKEEVIAALEGAAHAE